MQDPLDTRPVVREVIQFERAQAGYIDWKVAAASSLALGLVGFGGTCIYNAYEASGSITEAQEAFVDKFAKVFAENAELEIKTLDINIIRDGIDIVREKMHQAFKDSFLTLESPKQLNEFSEFLVAPENKEKREHINSALEVLCATMEKYTDKSLVGGWPSIAKKIKRAANNLRAELVMVDAKIEKAEKDTGSKVAVAVRLMQLREVMFTK